MKIKICGISRTEDVAFVNAAMPDSVGFVFAPSRRKVSLQQAQAMKKSILNCIRTVGVFVNAPADEIAALVDHGVIDLVQLHGDEDATYIQSLKALITIPVIKAIRVQDTQQIEKAQSLPCDYVLLDTYQKDRMGGTGTSFDWTLIPKLEKPYFLSGGLNLQNLAKAAVLPAYCLDISSGVETDGLKDGLKIRQAVDLVRRQP